MKHLRILHTISGKTAIVLAVFFLLYPWLTDYDGQVITWDNFGYYLYLKQGLIHGDLFIHDTGPINQAMETYQPSGTLYQTYQLENGNWMMKYSMGMAILYFPFFLMGHLSALALGYPMDGLSAPYEFFMLIGSGVYTVFGILILRKVLLKLFKDGVVALVLILICLGTNYYHIHTQSFGMPHMLLFPLYALLLWLTMKWHENPSRRLSAGLGLVIGLLTLARPSEAICIMIPLLWGVRDLKSLRGKADLLLVEHRKKFLITAASAFLMILPQLIYWKLCSGQWVYQSYNNPAEGLDLLQPHTYEFLFSYRKGWFLYTPLMIIGVIGIFLSMRRPFPSGIALIIFLLLNIWIISSWTTWWYAYSFSARAIVQSYPVMAVGLGLILTAALNSKAIVRWTVLSMCGLFLFLNQFQTWQLNNWILDGERMTEKYYWLVFAKTRVPEGAEKYLLVNRSTGATESFSDPEYYHEPTVLIHGTSVLGGSNGIIRLTPREVFTPKWIAPFHEITESDHAWLEYRFKARNTGSSEILLVSTFTHNDYPYKYRTFSILPDSVGDWNEYNFQYLTPEPRRTTDPLEVYFWNPQGSTLEVKDLQILSYIRKW